MNFAVMLITSQIWLSMQGYEFSGVDEKENGHTYLNYTYKNEADFSTPADAKTWVDLCALFGSDKSKKVWDEIETIDADYLNCEVK